ncbi:MAG: hypothetical protein Q8903_02300 [Bacteroidota bacterium]|nr:hypothetical protein [Bacteroidota bacterium]
MNKLKENIAEIASEVIERHNFFIIELVFRGTPKTYVIEIYIDGEKNVSADDCAEVSKDIVQIIEEKNIIEGSFRIEVSSPGVDRPLLFLKQYFKHINRKFDISYNEDEEIKKMKARLISIEGENLLFEKENKDLIKININNIIKAKVIVSFS